MDRQNPGETIPRPTVAFFAEFGAPSLYLLEKLLSNFCIVSVFTKSVSLWKENTSHLGETNALEFLEEGSEKLRAKFDYVLCSFLEDNPFTKTKAERGLYCARNNYSKALFLFPRSLSAAETEVANFVLGEIKKFDGSAAVICVGEPIGPRMNFQKAGEIGLTLQDLVAGGAVRVPKEGEFYPVYLPELAKEITKLLFSFGPPAERVAIVGERLTPQEILYLVSSVAPERKIEQVDFSPKEILAAEKTIKTKTPIKEVFEEVLGWFAKHPPSEKPSTIKIVREKKAVGEKRARPKTKTLVVTLAILLLLFPFLFLGISFGSLLAGAQKLKDGRLSSSGNYFAISSAFSSISQSELFLFSRTPILGKIFNPIYQLAGLSKKAASSGTLAIQIAQTGTALAEKVLGDEVYDPSPYSQEISLGLERLYQDIGFIEGEAGSFKGLVGKVLGGALEKIDIEGGKRFALLGREIALSLPEILGRDKQATYLVLLQNNMELRPTGGFIGSFALLTLDGGRLTDINVQDVYSADGQLKGHVEPPEPIKNHLGEANWFLRDSNWDPDFPTSASRAEWFLGKEIGKAVDGVVGIDLEVIKSLLSALGPVRLQDYNQEINKDNLYEITQKEVEEEFFPGSYKKSNFLTALTRQLIEELTRVQSSNEFPLARLLLENLQERHIQLFLHNQQAQKAISSLGFEGGFVVPACGGNCYADWLGVVEANVGVNKANYFIKRSFSLGIQTEDSALTRSLLIKFENPANSALGLSGRYKTYVRVAIPIDSEQIAASTISGQDVSALSPDIKDVAGRREVGVLLEIMPQQTKSLQVFWQSQTSLDFTLPGEYRLYWRKQAGTAKDPVYIEATFPQGPSLVYSPRFSLTKEGKYGYNTDLARDFFSRLSW